MDTKSLMVIFMVGGLITYLCLLDPNLGVALAAGLGAIAILLSLLS